MHKKNIVNIAGLEVEVVPDEVIIESQAIIVAVRLDKRTQKLLNDDTFKPGSKAGYFCKLCNTECILAPSGQAIYSVGKNKLVCIQCMLAMKGEEQ